MSFIGRAWRGEERLWKVFWVYGTLTGIAIGIFALIIKILLGTGIYVLLWIPRLVYLVWLMVAQWRCAFNADWKIWGYIVRILIVLNIIAIPLGLLVGVGMIGKDLVKAAECRQEMKAYVAKGGTDVEGFKHECLQRKLHMGTAATVAPSADVAPAVAAAPMDYKTMCEKTMTDYAIRGGVDPKTYIAQNQAYLQQCVQYYAHKNAAVTGKPQ